jgi:hypothetical protein
MMTNTAALEPAELGAWRRAEKARKPNGKAQKCNSYS